MGQNFIMLLFYPRQSLGVMHTSWRDFLLLLWMKLDALFGLHMFCGCQNGQKNSCTPFLVFLGEWQVHFASLMIEWQSQGCILFEQGLLSTFYPLSIVKTLLRGGFYKVQPWISNFALVQGLETNPICCFKKP